MASTEGGTAILIVDALMAGCVATVISFVSSRVRFAKPWKNWIAGQLMKLAWIASVVCFFLVYAGTTIFIFKVGYGYLPGMALSFALVGTMMLGLMQLAKATVDKGVEETPSASTGAAVPTSRDG